MAKKSGCLSLGGIVRAINYCYDDKDWKNHIWNNNPLLNLVEVPEDEETLKICRALRELYAEDDEETLKDRYNEFIQFAEVPEVEEIRMKFYCSLICPALGGPGTVKVDVCECGASKIGSSMHSGWCPLI